MASPTNTATISVRCSGNYPRGLTGKMKFSIIPLTAGDIVTQLADVSNVHTAVAALTLGVVSGVSVEIPQFSDSSYPTNPANRGSKWIISAQNANGRVFTYTIPAALETGNLQTDGYTADLTSVDWAAFKTAFEACAVDPQANALFLVKAHLGGRRR